MTPPPAPRTDAMRPPPTPRTVAAVTSSRADYGHLYWPLRELAAAPQIDLSLLVTGAHLSPEFGLTVREIERDGFEVAERIECLLSSDTDVAMAKTIGAATMAFADVLGRRRPDMLLLIADRYEMLAPACAALALRIPIAHIEGGDISEGAIDHAVRNALTMMSHLHLTPTELARRRVIAMGEEAWRVHRVGAPSLDHLKRSRLPSRGEVQEILGVDLSEPTIVVAYHPVTLERDTTAEADAVFAALARLPWQIVFCFPNADAGSRDLIGRAQRLCEGGHARAHLHVNLDHLTYWGLLSRARLLLGNSSSGIMESPSLGLPCVNIGRRQQGRERAANIIDVEPETEAIVAAAHRAGAPGFREAVRGISNPYGDGDAARRIAHALVHAPPGPTLLLKRTASPEPVGEARSAI